ncbi:UvrD-helicase domain-containing protein [Pseudoalteromonas sp. S16_S37]|uniref:UvrD-helicase domain-containing protein n=1 Tax=Pseudoalteromonas sp. S16_S37 TaxID=2720228 RepID=UPI001680D23E|nr:UvrD-helicase domain-containing protein [Pseudoalteromonas sp. S16_S37]MBD1584561.1 UvrD-helicase domain-containing protein [Pseudoalteromonas sp. S16_S37]
MWRDILYPPTISNGLLGFTIKIPLFESGEVHCVRIENCTYTNEHCQALWAASHSARLIRAIAKIERLLKTRYLSSQNLTLVTDLIASFIPQWLSWSPSIVLPENLLQAIHTLRELAQWQSDDIATFRRAYISYQAIKYQQFFDSIESQPLTEAQRRACIIQDNRQLLLAGAGTGKTSVMAARAKFLVHSTGISAAQILLLAYGNEAAKELKQRVGKEFNCSTFHALGMNIIEAVEGQKPTLSTLLSEPVKMQAFIRDTVQVLCLQPSYQALFTQFCRHECHTQVTDVKEFLNGSSSKAVLKHIATLISHYKNTSLLKLLSKIELKNAQLLECLKPIVAEYQLYLKNERAIDFEDMIGKAIGYLEQRKFIVPWHHIMVDEFQDLSPVRAKLLNALLKQSKQSHLFAVGDDWQSIYRFSGADVRLITHFSEHFGEASVSALDKTFRYSQQILDVSSQFVCANPTQLVKQLSACTQSSLPAFNKYSVDDDSESLDTVLERLTQQGVSSVLLLARYHRMLPTKQRLEQLQRKYPCLELKAMTFHASKGKEAQCCILMGLYEGRGGFPAQTRPQPLLNSMLSAEGAYPYAEERRLFYVALTRAKQQVILLEPKTNPSPFLDELNVNWEQNQSQHKYS